jgi:hypothetical protein
MDSGLQAFAIVAASVLLLGVLELVRRRRFLERYALTWLAAAVILLVLAAWDQGLTAVADLLGIAYPPNALFLVAFAFVLLLLLHFSLAVSRLTDQTKVLAQHHGILEERVQQLEAAATSPAQAAGDPAEPVPTSR